MVTYHPKAASIPLREVNWESCPASTGELHPFTMSSETGLGQTTDSTVLLSGISKISNLRLILGKHRWKNTFSYNLRVPNQLLHNHNEMFWRKFQYVLTITGNGNGFVVKKKTTHTDGPVVSCLAY